MDIRVVEGSLTSGHETVLVNASNTQLALGSGVSAAIRAACGRDFQALLTAELAKRGGSLQPGAVVVTSAGSHPRAKHVAHVAVMDYRNGMSAQAFPSLELVRAACATLWAAVAELPARPLSVAMVALGSGTGGLGLVDSVTVACETLGDHLRRNPATPIERVTFYGYALHEYLAMAGAVVGHFPQAAATLSAEAKSHLKIK